MNTEAKSEIQQIVLPESKLSAKTKSLKSRSYKYDKAGRLVSVVCEACPELNESYVYDKQGNILEKRVGDKTYTYKYDTANQLASMESPEGLREYVYDMAGRLIEEKLNGKTDVKYTYGYLDKVTEVNRRGNITKFVYDSVGMLASKISSDGKVENWMWDGLALIRRGKDIHVNEPHISGGVPIVSRTPNGTQFHESDFLGTTLWSIDTKGNVVSFQNDTIFGDGTIKTNRCARFTGKPYDEDLQAFVFPYRNYDERSARWRSADPAGYPDGLNQHFYAAIPTLGLDVLGLDIWHYNDPSGAAGNGHSAWICGNNSSGYRVYDYGNNSSSGSGSGSGVEHTGVNMNGETAYGTHAEAEAALQENRRTNAGHEFGRKQTISSTAEQDAAFNDTAQKYGNEDYGLLNHNCYQLGIAGVDAANKADPNNKIDIDKSIIPNNGFKGNQEKGWTER